MKAVYDADELAALLGVSSWSLYQEVRRAEAGEPSGPVGRLAIRVGKRVLFPKAAVDRILGLESQ